MKDQDPISLQMGIEIGVYLEATMQFSYGHTSICEQTQFVHSTHCVVQSDLGGHS